MRVLENIATVVIWYHPSEQQVHNIREYSPAVQRVYIIDNSEEDHSMLTRDIPNATYVPNRSNKGIATALNIGHEYAIKEGAKWIISFDQDSRISAEKLTDFFRLCENCPIENVGLFAPYPYYGNDKPNPDIIYERRESIITSGSLISATDYQQTGRFRDDFFIDLVDDEYCLRIKRKGKEIVIVNPIVIEHHIGNGYITTPFLHHRFVTHNALRHYYIVRNTLVLIDEYPEKRVFYRKQLRRRIKRLCLYDWHDKWAKFKMCVRAYRDYKQGKMNQFCN